MDASYLIKKSVNGWYERELFPAYYPFNEYAIETQTQRANYSLYKNHNIKFIVYNLTTYTNPYISFEVNTDNVSQQANMNLFYCNSSYYSGNPLLTTNCELISNIIPANLKNPHSHSNFSKHYVYPVVLNSVKKTQNSSFILASETASINNAFLVNYIINASYNNQAFEIGNYNSWMTGNNSIFDIHVHSFLANDSINYYTQFCDILGYCNSSNITKDYFEIYNQPPSASIIYTPNESTKSTLSYNTNSSIFISWSQGVDFENATLTYYLYLLRPDGTNETIVNGLTNTLNYTWVTNRNFTTASISYLRIRTCDNDTNCVLGSGITTFCYNNINKTTQPCINNAQLNIYSDTNTCDSLLEIMPADNGTYVSCVSLYTVDFDSDSIILTITELDILFWILIIVLIYFPFYMNDKRYMALYVFAGLLLGFYTMYMTNKLNAVIADNTAFVYIIGVMLYCLALLLMIFGFIHAINAIFSSSGEKKK
jgi:hypothetical protein